VWAATSRYYPALLQAGLRLARCHDLSLVEALLLARDGRHGEPATLAGAWARLRGEQAPRQAAVPGAAPGAPSGEQQALFGPSEPRLPGGSELDAVTAV